jgi:hypothetical protein
MSEKTSLEALRRVSLSLIERERIQQLLFLQTIRDAAILAGEQVQDVRLNLLENPPGVSVSDLFMDALISLALGPAASFAIKAAVNRGTRAILASRNAVGKKNGIYAITPFTSASIARSRRDFLEQKLEELIDPKAKSVELWKTFAGDVLGVPVDIAKRTARQAARKSGKQPRAGDGKGGDTASVAIRRAALAFSRLQELAVVRVFKEYEGQARADAADIELLLNLNNYLSIELPLSRVQVPEQQRPARSAREPIGNEEIERELSLFFEACIWVLHFGGQEAIRQRVVTTYQRLSPVRLGPYFETVTVLHTDNPIVRYWIDRFPHNKGNGIDSFLLHVERSGHSTSAIDEALLDLLAWFGDVEAGIAGINKKLQDFGGTPIMEVRGPIKPKK